MNDERGSLWRKWDLHVHTPASIEQQYGGPTEENWQKYLENIENLPSDFKVIGVNDYIFLDGYKRLRAEKDSGRLQNIDLLLPVIELRIDRFAGTDERLRRINYHVIFSDDLALEDIEQQFLNGLVLGYQLSPEYEHLTKRWGGLLTRENLARLGRLIIDSAPAEKRHQYDDPLTEGFRNFNASIDRVHELLENPLFEGKFVCGVGKTEWDQMRWTGSIAEKKTIINKAALVFTASETPAQWTVAKQALTAAGVNNRLLDCSDAHSYSSSRDKDRIGNCFTWIKADATFHGLRQALNEPDDRIYVGDEPEQFRRVRENRTKYISFVSIAKAKDSRLAEEWFDFTLPLNHGLIAIIGNRGMGKSALADTLAMLGDSHSDKFSFLDQRHFCNPRDNKGKHFLGTLVWESGKEESRRLDDTASRSAAMMVRYVPQNLFEEICNELPGSGKGAFSRELSDVIFSHVKEEDRLGCDSLEELIRLKTDEAQSTLADLRSKLKATNATIVRLEIELSPASRIALEQRIAVKREELKIQDESRPEDKAPPETDQAIVQQLEEKRASLEKLEAEIRSVHEGIGRMKIRQAALQRVTSKLERLAKQFEDVRKDIEQELNPFGIDTSAVLKFTINSSPVERLEVELIQRITSLQERIIEESEGNLWAAKEELEFEVSSLQARLDGPAREYQKHLNLLRGWKSKREQIVGDASQTDSLTFLEGRLGRLTNIVPEELEEARSLRGEVMRDIFRQLQDLATISRKLYRPVQDFLDSHSWVKDELKLEFGVSLEAPQFEEGFFDFINQGRKGLFHGVDEGRKKLRTMILKVDFNDEGKVAELVHGLLDALEGGQGGAVSQLKQGRVEAFYDFLFGLEYIQPRYTLNVSGRDLESLSPGERGMLLLVFYLLVDRGDVPLIIDQPEENLDNQSVFRLLVPCIKKVRKRRQIILVTHNPNLAVVCDAEQVVHAFIDKDNKNRLTYTSGAIENPKINEKIVDVLEGTWPAFRNRSIKYDLFPARAVDFVVGRLDATKPVRGVLHTQSDEEGA
jgi:energy-coupling factor transporter ATP-binding protein EcfA2